MGLFSRKKDIPASKPLNTPSKVNADDIWNTPVRKKSDSDTVTLKESKYSEAKQEKLGGSVDVDPAVLSEKMAELEEEIAKKNSKPVKTYHDYDVNPVNTSEVDSAQTKYEHEYEESHARYLKTHQEDISVASLEDIDCKLRAMIDEHSQKLSEMENMDFKFDKVQQNEVDKGLENLPYAKKEEDYPEYKDIKGVSVEQSEVEKLGSIDHSNDDDSIGSVSEDFLAQKMAEFNSKYSG